MVALPAQKRFTVDEYYRMADAGILKEDDRTELLEGEIIEMTPIGSRHAGHVTRLASEFRDRVGDRAIVSVQNPVRLSDTSEPEPDIALLEPREDFYASAHPRPDDVFLVVEVADTSIDYDRDKKIPVYARCGVTTVWIVDLNDRHVEVYENPADEGYQITHSLRGDAPVSFDELGIEFVVEDLFV